MFKNVVLKMAHVNTQEEIDLCPFQKKKTKFALTKLQEITLKSAVDFLYKNFYVYKPSRFFYFLFQEAEGHCCSKHLPFRHYFVFQSEDLVVIATYQESEKNRYQNLFR